VASFFVENFGCRATQADGAAIERQMLERGLARAEAASHAQVVVLNTCTVTASADQDVRSSIRRIHRDNPGCQIVVTGCYAQRAPEELSVIPGVSWVIGNSHKHAIAEVTCGASSARSFVPLSSVAAAEAQVLIGDIFAHTELLAAPVFEADTASEKTRPNLKVQDGCNNRCSFCIIPSVRGRSRSLAWNEVVREVNALVAQGYRELVISGINLGRWGRDFRQPDKFAELLRAILERTELERLRISSVEPMDWTEEVINLVSSSDRIARHAHVPMQSGSDRILRLMHRKYRPWHYADKIRKIRAAMPTAAIGADVMVGFPGETHADFEETRALIAELPFTYLHVFTYSARPGTPAAAMPNQVSGPVARERNRILRELVQEKKLAFQRSFVGKTISTITLTHFDGQRTETLTDNYQKLFVSGQHEANQIAPAVVESVNAEGMFGTLLSGS
jgi:threonylcarbamoyladenosine tRNA methylthiotransferase MtaB